MAIGDRKMLNLVNATPVPVETMLAYVEEISSLPREEQDMTGLLIKAVVVTDGKDPDLGQSMYFRMEALARLLVDTPLPGWARPQDDGSEIVHRTIFLAAAKEPIKLKKGQFVFDRDDLLRRAFQMARED